MTFTNKQIEKYIEGIYNGSITEYNLPVDLYEAIGNYFQKGLYKGFGMNLTEAVGKDLELLTQLRENTWMFSSAKTFQQTKDIAALLIDENGNRRTNKEFNDLGRAAYDNWNDNWGATEYITTVGQAQSASKWNEIEKNKKDLPMLRYSAVIDPNTSEICAPLDGIVAPVNSSIWNTISPLNHFRCRCVLLQEEESVLETSGNDKKVKEVEDNMQDVFKMNTGKDGYVFKKDHPYFSVEPKDKGFAKDNFGLEIPK
jgi:SPP1 gp7 family putative phage head morphogenesis protein